MFMNQQKNYPRSLQNLCILVSTLCVLLIGLLGINLAIAPDLCFALSGKVVLPFAATYGANNTRHSGMDLEVVSESALSSPIAGVVSFCGKIPKTDGRRVNALTITTEDSRQVTLSPLYDITFKKGDKVAKNDPLGVIASEGDPSSAAPHLHVSLRENKKYVDPSSLLAVVVASLDLGNSHSEVPSSLGVTKPKVSIPATNLSVAPHSMSAGLKSQRSLGGQTQNSTEHVTGDAQQPAVNSSSLRLQNSAAQAKANGGALTQQRCFSGLTMLKERQINASQISAGARVVAPHVHQEISGANGVSSLGEAYTVIQRVGLPQWSVALMIFFSGLTLTFAGWGGYTLLDEKFDVGRKLCQLAVRGQR